MLNILPHAMAAGAIVGLATYWSLVINDIVPEPYLVSAANRVRNDVHLAVSSQPVQDEIFHIPQAQHYCEGRFEVWDPKLTTPPGIYLLSVILSPFWGCSTNALRRLNFSVLGLLVMFLVDIYVARRNTRSPSTRPQEIMTGHNALNIALFPPLFFFYGLYYTDVASTLSVVIYYSFFLRHQNKTRGSSIAVVAAALTSLLFRQTNIFWVGVAPLILTVVRELDHGHGVVRESMRRRAPGFGDTAASIARTSWKYGTVFDPLVTEAYFEGQLIYILTFDSS
jgi:alpha-1,2-glucosyltransferase